MFVFPLMETGIEGLRSDRKIRHLQKIPGTDKMTGNAPNLTQGQLRAPRDIVPSVPDMKPGQPYPI